MPIEDFCDYLMIAYDLGSLAGSSLVGRREEWGEKEVDLYENGILPFLERENFDRTYRALTEHMEAGLSVRYVVLTTYADELEDILLRDNPPVDFKDPVLWSDPELLVIRVKSALRPNIYNSLSEIAQQDFVEAGRCIARGDTKAGVLLLCKVVETTLRRLYKEVTGDTDTRIAWEEMEKRLRGQDRPKFEPVCVRSKDFRINYRNPAVHEEKQLDAYDGQEVFNEALVLISRIVKTMPKTG
ncbi:MAG TPA: hypothetical protein VFA07_04870 [Chthonomonadaceae bacterium]|nr:hypothetical protein [Chthonomonadaceae bacterium]